MIVKRGKNKTREGRGKKRGKKCRKRKEQTSEG